MTEPPYLPPPDEIPTDIVEGEVPAPPGPPEPPPPAPVAPAEYPFEDADADGHIDDDPNIERPPPVEWTDPQFPDVDDDIPADTAGDITEVDAR
jgi:hypothetical protein